MNASRRLVCLCAALSCASPRVPLDLPRIEQYDTQRLRRISFDSAVVVAILTMHMHAQQLLLEDAACLYGTVLGDTLFVRRWEVPQHRVRARDEVTYFCEEANGYIGTVHTHLRLPGVPQTPVYGASADDLLAFWTHPSAVVQVISATEDGGAVALWTVRDGRRGGFYWPDAHWRPKQP